MKQYHLTTILTAGHYFSHSTTNHSYYTTSNCVPSS